MSETIQDNDDEILNQVCKNVGAFKIPKTVRDLRVLSMQLTAADNVKAHSSLLREFPPYTTNVDLLKTALEDLTNASSEDVIDPKTRYTAGRIIDHLHREVLILKQQQAMQVTVPQKERRKFWRRFSTTLKSQSASF